MAPGGTSGSLSVVVERGPTLVAGMTRRGAVATSSPVPLRGPVTAPAAVGSTSHPIRSTMRVPSPV